MAAKKLILGLKRAFIWCIFSIQRVNLPSHNHIHIAKYLFSIRDEWDKNLGDNTVLARGEMFSSGCRPRLKNTRVKVASQPKCDHFGKKIIYDSKIDLAPSLFSKFFRKNIISTQSYGQNCVFFINCR